MIGNVLGTSKRKTTRDKLTEQKYLFVSSGEFAIKPDKKSAAVIKRAKNVGMIAGGTGESVKSIVKGCGYRFSLVDWLKKLMFPRFRHHTDAADHYGCDERSSGCDRLSLAFCQPGKATSSLEI